MSAVDDPLALSGPALRDLRRGRFALWIVGALITAGALAALMLDVVAPALLGGLSGVLAVLSALAVRHGYRLVRRKLHVSRLSRHLEGDPAPHFLTDGTGRCLAATPACHLLSDGRGPPDLIGWLSGHRASPGTFVSQLRRRAEEDGSARSSASGNGEGPDIVVRPVGQDVLLWRVEGATPRVASAPIEQPVNVQISAEGTLAAVEDALPVALLKIVDGGRIVFANQAARKLLSLDEDSLPAFYDLAEGMGRPVAHWLADALQGNGLHRPEVMRTTTGGRELYLQVTLSRITPPEGPMLLAVLNDATELKSLEAQFVQSQKMQAIGQLAGGVAHDFNNLLTAISGHCDLLLLRHDEGDPDYGDLMQISQNANRAASLVGQLLAFSRKQTMRAQVMDLADTMSDLTHLLNRLVGEKIALDLDVAPLRKVIRADRRQFEQVIMNLVVNARDAMPEGGRIRIDVGETRLTSPEQRDRVAVPPGDYVTIAVTDQGVGIDPDGLPKIFEPFYTTKKTGEGTGLGLSTAYGIVKQSGGYIFAESKVGEGSRFLLYFPASDRPVAAATGKEGPGARPRVPHGEGVVLLVEDEAPVRAFAARALRLRGYTVVEAENAEEALARLSDPGLCVDLFVTDVIMPGMDGPSWVREALKKRPDTRVVFVSGYAEEAMAESQARIPNSVFLPKPFSLADLTTTVHAQLSA